MLAGRIIAGRYAEGAVLPSVEVLADELGVSRTVVREAMRVLSAKGFVVARQRAGTSVRPRRDWNLLDKDVLGWLFAGRDGHAFSDSLLALRRILEPEAAALAAHHGRGQDIAALEEAHGRMKRSVEDDPKEWVLADVDFHVALFTATGNVFLEQLARIIRTALLATFEVSTRQADSNTESLRLHGELVDHIRLRNAEAARADMVQLLKVAEGHLSGSLRGKTRARPGRAAATKRPAGQTVALPSRK